MTDTEENRHTRLTQALRRVILLRETGPKSAAWHRARTQTIWRLHRMLEQPTTAPEESESTYARTTRTD